MSCESAIDRLRRVTWGYQEACVLGAAAELDVFTAILEHGNGLAVEELAEELLQAGRLRSQDARGLTVLLDALAAAGFLRKAAGGTPAFPGYSVAEGFEELLDSRYPATFVPMIRHSACVMRSWVNLAKTVKEGVPAPRPCSILGAEEDGRSFIWAMNSIGRSLVGATVKSLCEAGVLDFGKENVRFLDIGGASGTYTQAFLEAMPGSRGTIFDLPVGIQAARERFAGTEFAGRVTFAEGDFYRDEFPPGQDFAWVSAIIHQHGLAETRELFRKTFRAMNPGGKIAVRDFVMDESRTLPRDGAFFGVNMLAVTKNGMVYTLAEIREALEAAGFVEVRLAVAEESMSAVIVGVKGEQVNRWRKQQPGTER